MSAPTIDSLESLTDAQVLEEWRAIERTRRELEAREVLLIAQVDQRGLAFDAGCKNVVDFARALLRIGARDAAGRVRLAASVGPRRTLTGDPVEAAHPLTAAALAVRRDLARGPRRPSSTRWIGSHRSWSRTPRSRSRRCCWTSRSEHDPETLVRLAHDLRNRLDQDGQYSDLERRHRRRELNLHRRADGSASVDGELTAEAAEYLHTLFDTLAKPQPGEHGDRDPRTPGQRRHDALLTGDEAAVPDRPAAHRPAAARPRCC